ncbi:MAG: 5'-methylthioadenosine phosphorylase [Parcubacteria group bacterium LiPW_39]|nr:MAG: 5'-methylthioadenosine phosphorylase [Parcubacteria group bacterium LiPW_39]
MKQKICIIGGTSLMESKIFAGWAKIAVKNKYGRVNIYQKGSVIFVQRHEGNVPPHKINYRAYIQALADRGVKKIISVNSVGSLKKSIKVPGLLLPHDFISPWHIPTFFNNEIKHVRPQFSERLRNVIIKCCRRLKTPIYERGIYWQAIGPRFETPAEIKMLARFADVVGMTLGSEATLASEKGIEFAAICSIDNYANGVAGEVNYEQVKAGAKKNLANLEILLKDFLTII